MPSEAMYQTWSDMVDLPEGFRLDPNSEQPGIQINGYAFVIMPDGTRTAWPLPRSEYDMLCPLCRAGEEQADCAECSGRGVVDHIPFADRPWDEVVEGLWLGGHGCQMKGAPPEGNCYLSGDRIPDQPRWDLVVSLHHEHDSRFEPEHHVPHLRHRMRDADLDPTHHTRLDMLATHVSEAVRAQDRVLVRCQAGLNRGSLVAGLALLKMGWSASDAIARMREVRGPYVLGNPSFVNYLYQVESAIKEA